jgi:hypothetical protein
MRDKFPRANDRTLTCRYVALWHETDMPTGRDDVRFRGKTGSDRHTVEVTRLTQNGHDPSRTVPEAVFTSGLAAILFFRCLSEARLLGRVSLSGLCNTFKNFPVPVSQLRSSVIHCRISIILRQRHPSGNIVGGAGQWFCRTNRPTPVLAPSLQYVLPVQVFSAAKAVSADACVG